MEELEEERVEKEVAIEAIWTISPMGSDTIKEHDLMFLIYPIA